MNNIFEQANRNKLRFPSVVGNLTVEDLWDLPLESAKRESLKNLATKLQVQIDSQPATALDFFETTSTVDPKLQLQFDIIKHIVITKMDENKAKSTAKAKESKRAHIESIIREKEDAALREQSIEELKASIS